VRLSITGHSASPSGLRASPNPSSVGDTGDGADPFVPASIQPPSTPTTPYGAEEGNCIGLLDIFGFESFAVNSFEQVLKLRRVSLNEYSYYRGLAALATASAGEKRNCIGLLDIFGFESFVVNSFEQVPNLRKLSLN